MREGTGVRGWGGGGWEGKERERRGRELAAWAEVGRPLRQAGRRCATQAWSKSDFLEDCKEMLRSLLLLVAALTFTKPLSLFAFLFPVCVGTGYFYLQCCTAVGPMRWVKVCETL